MSIATKTPQPGIQRTQKRVWRVPLSKAWWLWLLPCLLLYVGIYAWYLYALKTQPFSGPFSDPLRTFGIIAFIMVLGTAAYSLRRRFVRSLPGKAQDWLWMHIWVGITAVLIAFLHENYAHILHNYCQNLSCFTQSDAGTSALYALIVLVVSGVVGRLIDVWQTHNIAQDASTNGVGIVRAIEERILELEYTVERLCAGKSATFQQYCMQALEQASGDLPAVPALTTDEHVDFQRAYDTLLTHAHLTQSLQRQRCARLFISTWRSIHIVIASLALLIILYHGILELLTTVFHVKG